MNGDDDTVLVQLSESAISRFDFETQYYAWTDKNSHRTSRKIDRRAFLSILINLKKIALLASHRGFDKKTRFKKNLKKNIERAIKTLSLHRNIENRKLVEAYYRQQHMVNASHILRSVQQSDATVQHTKALEELKELQQRLLADEEIFNELARFYSDDPSVSGNNGYLGYFTVFDQLYPLENAAYRIPVGTVSDPVKSRFGYHLLKVHSRIKINGLKRVSHILIRNVSEPGTDESRLAKAKIKNIYSALTPANFAEVASKYSEDYESSIKGGDLGVDRLTDALEFVKITTKTGVHSEPFKSFMGWHILKVTGIELFGSFMQEREKLRKVINLDSRVQHEVNKLIKTDIDEINSPVLEDYAEDVLCSMLLSSTTNYSATGFTSRNDLIDYLMKNELTDELSHLLSRYQASINMEVLESILTAK